MRSPESLLLMTLERTRTLNTIARRTRYIEAGLVALATGAGMAAMISAPETETVARAIVLQAVTFGASKLVNFSYDRMADDLRYRVGVLELLTENNSDFYSRQEAERLFGRNIFYGGSV